MLDEKWNEENPESRIEIIYTEADLSVVFEHIQDGTSDFQVSEYSNLQQLHRRVWF